MNKHLLSKSTYMKGCQCHKALYLNKYHREWEDETSPQKQAVFDSGHEVGLLAQQLFPGGLDCSPVDFSDWIPSIEKTKALIEQGQEIIYEAAFQFDEVLAVMDILVKEKEQWCGYEVKGSTSAKPEHEQDIALQYYVITQSGLKLDDIQLIHLNNEYVRKGELDIQQLFTRVSLLEKVKPGQTGVAKNIKTFKALLAQDAIPDIDIGPQCNKPYDCAFLGHCWKAIPQYSVFNLSYGHKKSWELYREGILETTSIPEDYLLTEGQRVQVEADKSGKTSINIKEIEKFLKQLEYPLYFFDFETIMPAIPLFNESRPFQQIPFQYSLHIQTTPDAACEHKEFLAIPEEGDPRTKLLEQMLDDLGSSGSVVVFNSSFEINRLKELARDFPGCVSPIQKIIERIADLATLFQKKYYYHPEMRGSYSIKTVLPALVPGLNHKDLDVQGGMQASQIFLELFKGKIPEDLAQTRKELLAYCALDTFAMVRIIEVLHGM